MTRRSVVLAPVIAVAATTALLLPAGPAATAEPEPAPHLNAAAAGTVPVVASGNAGRAAPDAAQAAPAIEVTAVLEGRDLPWEVAFYAGVMFFTERDRERISARMPDGEVRTLVDNPEFMWHSGETGLMGLEIDPDFADNRQIYTCHGWYDGSNRDIRVVQWEIDEDFTTATRTADVVTGIQITSGRHGGCRLRFAPNGALHVGTGDAAVGTNPQDLASLNGKTLRVDAATGEPWPGNPYIDSENAKTQLIYTYGHRNVQGLAWRPGGGMWSAEHGSYRDDEVNRLKPGGNYGWNPVPGYDESVPMTDHSLPGRQIDAKWSSGTPTIATSGMAWLKGKKWGGWEGRLAVAALAGSELKLLKFSENGALVDEQTVAEFDGDFGRLRAVVLGPKNNLYVTTSNGGSTDRILKVKPVA